MIFDSDEIAADESEDEDVQDLEGTYTNTIRAAIEAVEAMISSYTETVSPVLTTS